MTFLWVLSTVVLKCVHVFFAIVTVSVFAVEAVLPDEIFQLVEFVVSKLHKYEVFNKLSFILLLSQFVLL